MFDIEDKIKSREEIAIIADSLREQGKKIVFTNGCFDILHMGHVSYLREARKIGDLLIIGLNSDASIHRLKGPDRPVKDQQERSFLLSALEFVDYVVVFEEDDPRALLSVIKPYYLVKGGDHAVETILGREYAQETLTIPFVSGYSTTNLINRVKESRSSFDK